MSSQVIEARSLSTLTALASNPPPYPRNPTHVRREQLVLYIARVPGSRDVFLTPMKPRDRVVSAEDIQSSLYFVHVEQPEDSRLIDPLPEPENRPLSVDRLPVPPRKAVPSSLQPANIPVAPKRKPVPGTLTPAGDFANQQNINASTYTQGSSGMLAPDYVPRRSEDTLRYEEENYRPPLPPRRPSEYISSAGFSLTLIRRDPVSSAQWNVASIKDTPIMEGTSSSFGASEPKRIKGAPVYIEIMNPGYSKFLNNPHDGGRPAPGTTLTHPGSALPSADSVAHSHTDIERGEMVFRRRLWLEGGKYPNAPFDYHKMSSNDPGIARRSPRHSFEDRQRERSSVDHRNPDGSLFLAQNNQPYSTVQVSEKQSSFRGYVFTSPWNGRCEFLTGAGGGSLKCRHIIPGLQGAPPLAMSVSELRFNLPSSSKISTPRGDESRKRSSFFHRPRHSRHNSSLGDYRSGSADGVTNSLDRLDLSLGQEFAGGGFGGRQAKLGKLIIDDEGLKMIDLLVAANIALWWRAYEKSDAKT